MSWRRILPIAAVVVLAQVLGFVTFALGPLVHGLYLGAAVTVCLLAIYDNGRKALGGEEEGDEGDDETSDEALVAPDRASPDGDGPATRPGAATLHAAEGEAPCGCPICRAVRAYSELDGFFDALAKGDGAPKKDWQLFVRPGGATFAVVKTGAMPRTPAEICERLDEVAAAASLASVELGRAIGEEAKH